MTKLIAQSIALFVLVVTVLAGVLGVVGLVGSERAHAWCATHPAKNSVSVKAEFTFVMPGWDCVYDDNRGREIGRRRAHSE